MQIMDLYHDKLFDRFFISFDNEGKIIISSELSKEDKMFLNIRDDIKIELSEGNKKI